MLHKEIKKILEEEVSKYELGEHPYFKSLIEGTMSKDTFLKTQEQFAYMVEYFSRPMALIISNIEDELTRMKIVENLWEEHGNGNPEKIHCKTILQFIDNIGGDSSSLNSDNADATVHTFNMTLKGISAFEDYRASAAMFAGIERIFVEVSEQIVHAVLKYDWMKKEEITHYGLHKEIDIQHAEDFLKVVESRWEESETKTLVKRGIQQGMSIFINVYSEFYNRYQNESI